MADQTRDVELKIAIQTAGKDQVNELANQLDALAKEGGLAAPELQRLAEQLRNIGEQDAAVNKLGQLQSEVDQTSRAFQEAKVKADEFGVALSAQKDKAEALRVQQAGAKDALQATGKQVRDTQAALELLKASTDDEGKKTAEYKDEIVSLGTKLAELKAAQREQRVEQQAANKELDQAESELKSAGKAYDSASSSAAKLGAQLAEQTNALNQARSAMAETGVQAADVAAAQNEVAQSMERTRAAVAQEVEAYQQLVTIERAVAESNERNVALARAAADARVAAARQVEQAAQEQQRSEQAAALAAKLAAQEQEAAAKQAASAAREAQDALNQAFGTIGVRSAQQITAELERVRAAMATIRNTAGISGAGIEQAMLQGQARVNQLERELRAANGQLTLMDRAAGALNSTIGQFTAGALFANVIQNAAYQVGQLGVEAVQANVELQKLELGLKAVYGTTDAAGKQLEFLRNTAQAAGVEIGSIGGSYVKFAAAAQAANIPVETTNGLFSALAKNAATLGLSGDKVADMLNALGQMASKGVVQMEELRGQLGDALPGALPKVAQGLGITTLEMEKLARNGELLASEVFPALQKVLEQQGGEIDTISARWARFKNVMTEAAQDLGEGAVGKAIGDFASGVGRALEHLVFTASLVGEGFTTLGQRIGVAVADIANQGTKFRGFSQEAQKAFQDIDDAADKRMQNLAARIEGIAPVADKAFGAVSEAAQHAGDNIVIVGDKVTYVSQQAQGATPVIQANAQAHAASADAAAKNAVAQGQAGAQVAAAGQSANAATGSWTQLTVAYLKINDAIDQQVKLAHANLEAKKAEGAAAQDIARLSGDEAAQRLAAANAARDASQAQSTLTSALETQLNVLRAQRDAEVALYDASTKKNEAQRKAIEDLSKNIQLKAEELAKSREVAAALQTEAAARQAAIETLKDNSSRVDELQKAYGRAAAEVARLTQLQKQGAATTEQVTEAKRQAAVAERLYNDALEDQVKKLQETSRAQQAKFGLQESGIRLAIEEARTAEEVAKARGDERGAMEASNRVKQLEIDLLRLQAQAQRAEAEAILAALPAKRAQLELEGKLTEAMQKSLEAEELSARAKLKQSQITDELASRIGRVQRATDEAGGSAQRSAGNFDSMSGSMGRAAGSADRLTSSLIAARGAYQSLSDFASHGKQGENYTEGGVTYSKNAAGQLGSNQVMPGYEISAEQNRLFDYIHSGTALPESDRAYLQANLSAAKANLMTAQKYSTSYSLAGLRDAEAKYREAQRAYDSLGSPSSGTSGGAPAGGFNTAGSTHTVNVMLGGQQVGSVNTASFADAQNLTNILQQLGTASTRTT